MVGIAKPQWAVAPIELGNFNMAFSITSRIADGCLLQTGRGGRTSKFGTLISSLLPPVLPLIFVRTMSFMSSGFPRRKLSWYQTWSLPLPLLSNVRTILCEKNRFDKNRRWRVIHEWWDLPTKSPQMQLSVERSNLCLIEEQGDNLFHELDLIVYPERPSVWKPRNCLCKLENVIREFKHCVDLDREFRLCPPWRGWAWCSHIAGRSRGSLIGVHFFRLCWCKIIDTFSLILFRDWIYDRKVSSSISTSRRPQGCRNWMEIMGAFLVWWNVKECKVTSCDDKHSPL